MSTAMANQSLANTIGARGGGYLPYEEPSAVTLLILASFVLLLNGVNVVLDRLLYCGLVGQILVGVAWGAPGANILSIDTQRAIVQLGYLGLILLVYEVDKGGISTSVSSVKQNALLSIGVALVGICLPIAFSFVLVPLLNASPLQAFAAGAALCSTSLGTTFTVLSTCGLATTRLGTVLTTAAMLDDVVGLIMVQVVSNLGRSEGNGLDAGSVIRPIGVSLALIACLFAICRFLVLPFSSRILPAVRMLFCLPAAAFVVQSLFLIGVFTGSSYAGTSGLFAAYSAGVVLSWWDRTFQPGIIDFLHGGGKAFERTSGSAVFESSYASITNLLLRPFFFASIGFSIPVTKLFSGNIAWRGIVYTILMLLGKFCAGSCLLRFRGSREVELKHEAVDHASTDRKRMHKSTQPERGSVVLGRQEGETIEVFRIQSDENDNSIDNVVEGMHASRIIASDDPTQADGSATQHSLYPTDNSTEKASVSKAGADLYPALLLGFAMTARGEIGYLIASVAQSSGVFAVGDDEASSSGSSDIFLVVIWAITLCTILGPFAVGLLIGRVRKLDKQTGKIGGRAQALGSWGEEVD